MSKVSIFRGAACLAALVFLAACGGGGSRDSTPSQPPVQPGPGPQPPLPPPPPPPPTSPPPDPGPGGRFPLMFVTQAPIDDDGFAKIIGTFGHHIPAPENAPRGGDLLIAYPQADGTFQWRNLTREAGFGMKDATTAETAGCAKNMVAVREPAVSWDGKKALVSMVVGCGDAVWQLYEVEGLERGQTAKFTHLVQPEEYNNIAPIYSPEGDGTSHIIYASDMSWHGAGAQHLKCLDEYEEQQGICGLFKLDRAGGVTNLDPSPSGSFTPTIDSFGRLIFTRWDHLESDQQEEGGAKKDLFNWHSEEANAPTERVSATTTVVHSVFPELKFSAEDGFAPHAQKPFLAWEMNVDGTGGETLNHLGRQELKFVRAARSGETAKKLGLRDNNNANTIELFRFLREDPRTPGRYFAVPSLEFGTCGGGAIATIDSAPDVLPADVKITYVTDPSTVSIGTQPIYRSPLPASNGELWASVSTSHKIVASKARQCDYRLVRMVKDGEHFVGRGHVTPEAGLQRTIDGVVRTMWEWDVVEVIARTRPTPKTEAPLEAGEMNAFAAVFGQANAQQGLNAFRTFLKDNKLALAVVRNVTWRQIDDLQQPFNLSVGADVITKRTNSTADVLGIDHLQVFTGQQLRGKDDESNANGLVNYRRVLAQPAREILVEDNTGNPRNVNPPTAVGVPASSTKVSTVDGSVAFIVQANRPITWQTIDSTHPGDPLERTDAIVRERYWIGFQPGEMRMCPACHGGLDQDRAQSGKTFAELKALGNKPDTATQSLVELLTYYKANFFNEF
jgi:hypothetical protein